MLAAPAFAEGKGHGAGGPGGKGGPQHGDDRGPGNDHRGGGHDRHDGVRFADQARIVVHDYYGAEVNAGHCPPGLAKKHNGCMPPGQARRWAVGRPLPRDVIFYDLPRALVIQLGAPPPGYRYVRVASDILMIAVGTGLVMDAILDLGGMS
jgi:hypothetical protein